ncbi:MAG: hypothetical protein KDK44_02425 [Chlamydiia bacterium]|nr:hypothetical protein [Chlamydiia bacterium]MCP5509510.1 hypothetical protein [Chlamydiales bacterium]
MRIIIIHLLISVCYAHPLGLLQLTCLNPSIRLQPLFDSKDRVSNYHGQFGQIGYLQLEPKLQPYGSFIFEDRVFWTRDKLKKIEYRQPEMRQSKSQTILDCHRAGS